MNYYQLLANYDGVKLDVRVNDMPVIFSTREQGAGVHVVNNLLTGADNTITVVVRPPQGKVHPAAGASVEVNITAFPGQGGSGGKGHVLYTYDWRMKDIHTPLPHVQGHFQAQPPPSAPLSWQNAEKLDSAHLDKAGINAQIKRLYEALEARSVPETTALLTSELHDQAVGLGRPAADLKALQNQYYADQFGQPALHFHMIHYDALEYDLYGDGRVVLVHPHGVGTVFTSTPDKDGGTIVFNPYLALIKGQWVIVQ